MGPIGSALQALLAGDFTAGAEEALVDRARAGDDRSFEALVRAYQDRILTLCRRMTGEADVAEDLT
ncbi:MAG: hypothetical protein R6V19_02900 [Armatimonadota bacterium]